MRIPAFIPGTYAALTASEIKRPLLMPFPFGGELAATLSTAADHTWFPSQQTIEKCIEWYWRVESWMMSISIVGQGTISGSTSKLLRARAKTGTDERTITDATETSASFVPYDDDDTVTASSVDFTSGGYDFRIQGFQFYLLTSDSGARRRYQLQESTFPQNNMLPTIGVFANVFYKATGAGSEYTYGGDTFTALDTGLDYIMGTATIGADNEALLQMPLYWDGLIPDGERLTSVDISIVPYRYWPYAKAGGTEPIWDDETGAQLRNVITGELL